MLELYGGENNVDYLVILRKTPETFRQGEYPVAMFEEETTSHS